MMQTLINRSWFIPVFFVFVALAARLPHLATNGSPSDYDTINAWGESVYRHNFAFYAITSADHPPLFPIYAGLTNSLSDVPTLAQAGLTDIVRLKLPSLAAILLLVAIVGYWLRNEGWTRLFVLTLLALHPGMIANSAVWTQSDSIFTLFLVLMLLMMRTDRPRVAWVFFALALLTKFQSIVLLPLLVVLTFRRYSWQEFVRAAAGAVVIVVVVLLPFVLASGLSALAPYLGSVNSFPHTTGNAYNIWVAFEPGYWTRSLGPLGPDDSGPSIIPFLSNRQMGMLLLGIYTLLIVYHMWRRPHETREFVWGSALYFGFFMLPTQIHERYLYPGIVMAIIGVAQDRRMALVAVVSVVSFTFNIVTSLGMPYIWAGSSLRWFTGIYPPYIALMNVLLLIQVAVAATTTVEPRTIRAVHRLAVAGLLSVFLVGPVITVNLPQDTTLLQEVDVGEGARLVGYRMVDEGEHVMLTLYWQATRLIPTLYRSHLELVHDGRVIAVSDGSAEEVRPGSWRWNRGRVYPVTYWFDLTEKPDPDAIRAMFYEDSTRRTLTVAQNGTQIPGNTLVVEASR